MSETNPVLLTTFAAAIAAEFGFIIWLFRFVISLLNDRVKQLEVEQRTTLLTLAEIIRPIPSAMQVLTDVVREVSGSVKELSNRIAYRADQYDRKGL